MGRYIRYWYTYRTVVAVLIGLGLSLLIYGLYMQQVACDTKVGTCVVNVSVHPEDRFVAQSNPSADIVIVGIDNQSLQTIGHYPVPRDVYAQALQTLESDGAAVVAFDIGLPDPRDPATDAVLAKALATSMAAAVAPYMRTSRRVGRSSSDIPGPPFQTEASQSNVRATIACDEMPVNRANRTVRIHVWQCGQHRDSLVLSLERSVSKHGV